MNTQKGVNESTPPVDKTDDEGMEIELEDENSGKKDTKNNDNERSPEEILAEANRKLAKAKEVEKQASIQQQTYVPAPQNQQPDALSPEAINKIMAEKALETGFTREDNEGNLVPDVERFRKHVQLINEVNNFQNKSMLDEINSLKGKLEEQSLNSNRDYSRFKNEIDEIINTNETLKSLKGKISKTELKSLALEMAKTRNPNINEFGTAKVLTNKPDVSSTVTDKKPKTTVKLTKEDMDIIKDGNLDPQAYARAKTGKLHL